jgi:Co/Zn/Cd efflux system component
MMVQAVFAIIANSESMLADSEAMSVDALTYLFNMFAESIKNRPLSPYELSLPSHICKRRRTMKRLYLELIPPLISVTTLIVVTVYVMRDSLQTFFSQHGEFDPPEEDVDITIMLLFSGFNLLLDIVNVTCFARAQQAFGLQSMHLQSSNNRKDKIGEGEAVQSKSDFPTESTSLLDDNDQEIEKESMFGANLNMCSAWTVSL